MIREEYRANPALESYIATMLQDVQYCENDEACTDGREARDVSTIWNLPDATFNACKRRVESYQATVTAWPDFDEMQETVDIYGESVGSDLYLEQAGHGAGFTDRDHYGEYAQRLSDAWDWADAIESYVGDDGAVWISGAES